MKKNYGPWVLLAALLPTAALGYQSLTLADGHAQARPPSIREKALASMATDATVLINIKSRDMPASPDILALGKKATKALSRCLADNIEAYNRERCAITLHALGDRGSLPTLQAALEDWEPSVRYQVVRALGAMPDATSVDPLIKLFERKDEEDFVKREILASLAHISDQRVVRMLRGELREKAKGESGPDLRAEAFDALWKNRHLMARATLIGDTRAALKSDNNALVLSATLASAELRSPRLVPSLIPLMEHEWPEVRNKAVYALGKIGDKKATSALLKHLPNVRESRMLNNIAFALERLDKQAFYKSIKSVIEHKQAIIRLNAAFVLGDVRHGEGLPMLQEALGDSSDFVRTSAVVAVGKLGNTNAEQTEAAIKSLEPLTSHANLTVREEAVYAIHTLAKGTKKDLIHDKLFSLDRRRHAGVVRRAAVALAAVDDTRVKKYVFACVLDQTCDASEVDPFVAKHADERMRGRLLLSWSRGETDFTPLLATLKPEGTLPMARSVYDESYYGESMRSSLDLIASLSDKSALDMINGRAKGRHTFTRIFALVTAARLGDTGSHSALLAELDNLPVEYLPRFVIAAAHIDEKAVQAKLTPELVAREKSPSVDLALAAAAVHLAWDPDAAIFRFLDALGSTSSHERDLAERYLASDPTERVTWLLRRALAREGREDVRDRMRVMLDERG